MKEEEEKVPVSLGVIDTLTVESETVRARTGFILTETLSSRA